MYSTLDKNHFSLYKMNIVYNTIPRVYPQSVIEIFDNKDEDNLKEFIEVIARTPAYCEWILRIPSHYIELKDIYLAHKKEISELRTQIYRLNLLVNIYRPNTPTTNTIYEKKADTVVDENNDILIENERLNIELNAVNWRLNDITKMINGRDSTNKLTIPSKLMRTTNFHT